MHKKFSTIDLPHKALHQLVLGSVAPRPIAFVSTIGPDNILNLAPYSFFTAISSAPPLVAFSANIQPGPVAMKDTLANIKETKFYTINSVSLPIWKQMALTSVKFAKTESEFEKAGLTASYIQEFPIPYVEESPIAMCCKLKEIREYGNHPGAGRLIIGEVLHFLVNDAFLTEEDKIVPHNMNLVSRMGRTYYNIVESQNIHAHYQALDPDIIGFDALPRWVTDSNTLSANMLSTLAALPKSSLNNLPHVDIESDLDKRMEQLAYFVAQGKNDLALAVVFSV